MAALIPLHHNEISTLGKRKGFRENIQVYFFYVGGKQTVSSYLIYEFSVLKFCSLLNPHPCLPWTALDLGISLLLQDLWHCPLPIFFLNDCSFFVSSLLSKYFSLEFTGGRLSLFLLPSFSLLTLPKWSKFNLIVDIYYLCVGILYHFISIDAETKARENLLTCLRSYS